MVYPACSYTPVTTCGTTAIGLHSCAGLRTELERLFRQPVGSRLEKGQSEFGAGLGKEMRRGGRGGRTHDKKS